MSDDTPNPIETLRDAGSRKLQEASISELRAAALDQAREEVSEHITDDEGVDG